MKRPDEEHCRAAYDCYLATRFPGVPRDWEESERPDYFLDLGNERFAVEVTSVVEVVEVRPTPLPALALEASAFRLIERLEAQARAGDELRGTYVVCLSAIHNFPAHRAGIVGAIGSFIADTRQLAAASKRPLLPSGDDSCTIAKASPDGSHLVLIWDGDAKWEGEAERELTTLLCDAVRAKSVLLAGQRLPIVLLLLDRYHLGSPAVWQRVARTLSVPEGIVALLRILWDSSVDVLWETGV